jgi:gamma-glutamylputrescine oxidase
MRSIWETRHFHRPPDLVVVGGGIVGLFTALFHKRANPHHHVVILERGPFPSGASVKNAGFACFGSPSELLADETKEGTDAMLTRVENRWKGLLELRAELGDVAIGFEPTGGHEIYGAHDPLYTHVAERFDALNAALWPIFGRSVFEWDDPAVAHFGLRSGHRLVKTDLEGPLDSGALMSTLLLKVQAAGVLFRPNCSVVGLEDPPSGVQVMINGGEVLRAANVVLCTNGYARQIFPELPVEPARGQVLKTAPIPGLKLRGTFHYNEGFFYFRDHDGGVLLGGGRNLDVTGETTWEDATTEPIQNVLEDLLRNVILPGTSFQIVQRWSGIMGMGPSKSPIVERRSERVVVAVRLGGMGVALGIRVARQAAELVGL